MQKHKDFIRERIIGDFKITLPECPPIDKIANYKLPKPEQKFTRTELPKDFKNWTPEARKQFILQEWDRRINGFWFYCNGNIEYITGLNYFYINWWRINTGFPQFVDCDRDFFYVWKMCEDDPLCDGLVYITHRGEGKALDINTKIPTPNGWKTMEQLQVGDSVFGSDGLPTIITYISPIREDRDCYELTFSDESKIIADAEHLWIAQNKVSRAAIKKAKKENWNFDNHKDKVITTKHIFETQKYLSHETNWSVRNCEAVQYNFKELEIPPYILGLWLGDGTSSNTGLTNIDEQLISCWSEFGKSIGLECRNVDEITYNLVGNVTGQNNIFRSALKKYNVFNNKHIPTDYLQSRKGDRFDLLCGIMDTDGCVNSRGTCLEVCTKSEVLAKCYKELIVSLGYKVKITTKLNKKYNKTYFYLRFSHNNKPPFKLQRKLDKIKYNKTGGWDSNLRYITNIKKVDSVPVKCISVDNSDSSYLCSENFIVTHNTYKATAILYEPASRRDNVWAAIQSKTEPDAKKIFKKLVYSWTKLPYFFRPIDVGISRPSSIIEFAEPSKRDTKSQEKVDSDVLNSSIDYRASSDTAYDGDNLHRAFQDEIGKTVEVNVDDRMKVVRETLRAGRGKYGRGKIIATSTVEEMLKKGGKNCKTIWDKADSKVRDANGFTKNGLYRLFKPSDYGYLEIMNGHAFVDEYGYSLREKAKQFFMNKRASLTGADLNSEKRKFPLEEKDIWVSDTKKAAYDTTKLEQQQEYNKTLSNGLLKKGNFYWIDGVRFGKVGWNPDPINGRWILNWMPVVEQRNRQVIKNGKRAPALTELTCAGLDPFDNNTTVDDRKSDAASYVFLKFDPLNPYETGNFICEYVGRPNESDKMFEDILMQAIFYGHEILIESNKIGCINFFLRHGYENYLMRRPEETQTKSSRKMEDDFGIPMSGAEARQALVYAIESHVINRVGVIQEEGKEAYWGRLYFDKLLQNLLDYDVEDDWTKYDSMIGAGLALLASRKYIPKKKEIKPMKSFPKYNTSGAMSELITTNPNIQKKNFPLKRY